MEYRICMDSPMGSTLICSLVKHIGDRKVLLGWPVAAEAFWHWSTALGAFAVAPYLWGLGPSFRGSGLIEAGGSGNGSRGVSICCCFACISGLMKELSTHLLFSMVVDSTLAEPLFDESDESELEPSDPLSLELSLFGDALLCGKRRCNVIFDSSLSFVIVYISC